MFFRASPDDHQIVYLLAPPYTTRAKSKRGGFLTETPVIYGQMQEEFTATLLRWCLEQGVIKRHPMQEGFLPIVDQNIASLSYLLHCSNFQKLVYQAELRDFLKMIADDGVVRVSTTAVQQLMISLMALHTPEFLQYQVNRIYRAFAALPLGDADFTWGEIHRRHPFMWVVLSLHVVVKNFTTPRSAS